MSSNSTTFIFLALTLIAAGCGDGTDTDAGAGADGGGRDGGTGVDAGPAADAGDFDAGGGGDDAGMATPDAGDTCASLTLPALDVVSIDAPAGDGWRAPIHLTHAPGANDLYVVEQRGRVRRIAADGTVTDFVDISRTVDYGGERGLLGMAFHPNYASNGRFFLYYTPNGRTAFGSHNHVGEFQRLDAATGDPDEVRSIVTIDDPESNHNGGMIAFGPDGFLYVGMGDGGGGGDGHGAIGNGLDTTTVLGKILRLDVDNEAGMFAAAGNPFIGMAGDDRIWAYGIRNPWRFSFDALTGDLYIADVGQGRWEEIDFQPASSSGGENYGWRAYEGFERYEGSPPGDLDHVAVHTEPVFAYPRGGGAAINGNSVTGGYVYRGSAIPELQGWYLFADFVSGDVAALKMCDGSALGVTQARGISGGNISSFGEGADRELYIIGFDFVRRIVGG